MSSNRDLGLPNVFLKPSISNEGENDAIKINKSSTHRNPDELKKKDWERFKKPVKQTHSRQEIENRRIEQWRSDIKKASSEIHPRDLSVSENTQYCSQVAF